MASTLMSRLHDDLNEELTRKSRYRKDDRAKPLRPIYECPENCM